MPHSQPSNGEPGWLNEETAEQVDGVEARAADLHEQNTERRANRSDDVSEPVQSAPRRLAPPPWQLHTTIGSQEFPGRFESSQQEHDSGAHADDPPRPVSP